MTNWWRFTGDWDSSIRGGLGLHERAAPACGAGISNGAAAAAVETLADQVQALLAAGRLSQAEAHALGVKLNGAERLLHRRQTKAAANLLQAFVNQVNALVRGHRLSHTASQPLTGAAACLITRLGG